MQVEHIEDMKPGDFIRLPNGEWDTNKAAQAMYAKAHAAMDAHEGEGPAPQFQVQSGPAPTYEHQLERIR